MRSSLALQTSTVKGLGIITIVDRADKQLVTKKSNIKMMITFDEPHGDERLWLSSSKDPDPWL